MGYKMAGAVAVKMAHLDRDVVVMVGNGSYMMLNSELATSVMLGHRIIVVILDNREIAWWDVAVPQVSDRDSVNQTHTNYQSHLKKQCRDRRIHRRHPARDQAVAGHRTCLIRGNRSCGTGDKIHAPGCAHTRQKCAAQSQEASPSRRPVISVGRADGCVYHTGRHRDHFGPG